MSTSVLIVDDHVLLRNGLRQALESEGEFEVIAEAATGGDAVRVSRELRPAVVIIEINLPDGSGLDVVRRLRVDHPDLGIVVLTMHDDDEHLFGALEAQASAFVTKTAPAAAVLAATRHAAVAPHSFSANNLTAAMQRRMDPARPKLSPREEEVLVLLSQGMTVPLIAKRLYLSNSTSKSYVAQLYEKLGASNRSQALLQAIRLGLLKVPAEDVESAASRST